MTRLAALTLVAALGSGVLQTPVQTPVPPVPPAAPVRDPGSAPQTGTGTIAGTVMTTEVTPQPVRRANVSVSGGGLRQPRQGVTDAAGRFAIPNLPAGTFTLTASKASYVSAVYGSKAPGQAGTPIALGAGQTFLADVRIPRGAVVSGTVFDPFGRPKPQTRVQAMQYRTQGGQRRLQQAGSGLFVTDDRGMFRIYGLPAGEFVLVASPQEYPEIRLLTADELRWAADARLSQPGTASAPPPPGGGPTVGLSPIYFPGASDLTGATTITLSVGEERGGLDFQLQHVPTARIEGVLLTADGGPARQPQITLVPDERLRPGTVSSPIGFQGEARVESATGKFTFSGVTPGRYTVIAQARVTSEGGGAPPAPPTPPTPVGAGRGVPIPAPQPMPLPTRLWAMAPVDVEGRNITNLGLTLQPGLSISGRVVFEASTLAPPTDASRTRLSLNQMGPMPFEIGLASGSASANGTFTLTGVMPGHYRLNGSAPPAPGPTSGPWILKSVVANGRDTMDTGFEVPASDVTGVVVTFTDRVTELSGTLFDAAGAPTRDVWVLCFSTDRTFWTTQSRRVRVLRPSLEGKFRFSQWVPGEYFLVAVTDGDQIDLSDQTGLEQIAAVALRVTLVEGEKKVQDLKLAR